MSFAAFPLGYVLAMMAAAGVVTTAAYLLRRTPRRIVVSHVAFWIKAAERARPRVLFDRRIPLLSLLVSLLVALAFVALIGDPRFGDGVRSTTVIVIDAGGSMRARTVGGETRLARAIGEAHRTAERATVGGSVVVVRAGMTPHVLVPLTDRLADVEPALRALEADEGPSDLSAALSAADAIIAELAGEASNGAGERTILYIGDRDEPAATRAPLVRLPVGTNVDTVAIDAMSARRVPTAVGEYAVLVGVANESARTAHVRVHVRDGDTDILDERIELAPHARRELEAGGFSSERAELVAELASVSIDGSSDGYTGDDRAMAVVDALDATRVLLVGDDPFLRAALAAHPGLRVDVSDAAPPAAELAAYHAIVIAQGALPPTHPARVIFGASGAAISRPRATGVLLGHPVLEGLFLDDVSFSAARALPVGEGDRVLLRSREQAFAIAHEGREGREVRFGFRPEDTDLVRRATFPLLVDQAIRWVAGREEQNPLPRRLGGALFARAGETIHTPSGDEVSTVPVVRESGLYRIGTRTVAVSPVWNAAPLAESAVGGRFLRARSLPPLLVLVAFGLLALMLLEWALLHRGRLT